MNNGKKYRKTTEWERLEIPSRKLAISREHFMQGWACDDLTEAEEIKKWQEYTKELYKKGLKHPDNCDGVVTHLEPDILECEVKWALGSSIMNKASGDDEIPAEVPQILEDDAIKVLHSVCQHV